MSSLTFESMSSNCPVSSMLLDSNKGNTCAASSVANMSHMMHYNNNAIFTPHHVQHTISPLVYTNMACSTSESSTSSVSSSHTRLHNDLPNNDLIYNPNMSNLQGEPYKTEELENDLEPISRDRCNTWPMRRPTIETQTSPLIHEQIPEEDSVYGSDEQLADQLGDQLPDQQEPQFNNNLPFNNQPSACDEENDQFGDDLSPDGADDVTPPGSSKKSATRRNAWGNLSYADLITQAILSSNDQRLTLSQVYEWMVANVPYFSNKGDSNSSAGWKNSIRHNLSLHNRFMRIQNEGAGKSSWWTINPEAKPGRNPRRRAATMESSTKAAIDKKRRGARKRLEVGGSVRGSTQGLNESVAGSQMSMTSQDLFNDVTDDSLGYNFERFRARTQSNLSMPGGKMSPSYDEYPPWVNTSNVASSLSSQLGPISSNVTDIMNRTDQMRLDSGESSDFCSTSSALKDQRQSPLQMTIQTLKQEEIKQEPIVMQQPPPYQEIVQSQAQMRPLMHSQIQPQMMQQPKLLATSSNSQPQFYQTNVYNMPSQMINQMPLNNGPTPISSQAPMPQQQPSWLQMQQPQMHQQPQQMIFNQPPQPQFGQLSTPMMMNTGRPPMGQQLPPIGNLNQPELPKDLMGLSNLDSQLFMDTDFDEIMRTL